MFSYGQKVFDIFILGFGRGRGNFFQLAWVVFWICAEDRVHDVDMFLSLLSRGCTEPGPFLLFILRLWGRRGNEWEVGRGHRQDR